MLKYQEIRIADYTGEKWHFSHETLQKAALDTNKTYTQAYLNEAIWG